MRFNRVHLTVGVILALSVLTGCGGGSSSSSTTSSGTPTPSGTATATPAATPSPTPATLTAADANALLNKLLIPDSGYWYECDLNGHPLSGCPLTDKLKTRLQNLFTSGPGGGPPILRQQYFVALPTVLSNTSTAAGATLRIRGNTGTPTSPNIDFDLLVVDNGGWLIDDVMCAGNPATSAYQSPNTPGWVCS